MKNKIRGVPLGGRQGGGLGLFEKGEFYTKIRKKR